MSFRKKPIKVVQALAPETWSEEQISSTPTIDEDGRTVVAASIVSVSSDKILDQQLDPSIVTMDNLISQGLTINPSSVGSLLNPTDCATNLNDYEAAASKIMDANPFDSLTDK